MKNSDWSIGIDLGGTKIEAAHVDKNGKVQSRGRKKTNVSGGPDAVMKQIVSLVHNLTDQTSSEPSALGIGIAGQINAQIGSVRYAPNLNWNEVAIKSPLEDKLLLPVTVLNDVRAAAWGEWLHGAGRGLDDMICIFVGTGVGGGIVSGGRMLNGASNMAGEIGHLTISIGGPRCHCGNYGCLEALAGSWAIERDAKKALKKAENNDSLILDEAGGSVDEVTATHTIDAYEKGDPLAISIISSVIDALAAGLTGLTNVMNPQRIIMGGGVTEHIPDLPRKIEQKVKESALDTAVENLDIVPAELHSDSGVIGAATYAMKKKNNGTK